MVKENIEQRSCAPGCVRDGYVGVLVNMHATPRAAGIHCALHRPGAVDCEALLPCQGCSEFWMRKPGAVHPDGSPWGNAWHRVDRKSDNCNRAHHKLNHPSQLGATDIRACPEGDGPASARCSVPVVVNVRVP